MTNNDFLKKTKKKKISCHSCVHVIVLENSKNGEKLPEPCYTCFTKALDGKGYFTNFKRKG